MTYAAGLEAVTIIWVADKLSEEQAEVEARMGYSLPWDEKPDGVESRIATLLNNW